MCSCWLHGEGTIKGQIKKEDKGVQKEIMARIQSLYKKIYECETGDYFEINI